MAKISDQELEMGIASFIEKRGYAGLRVELTPQQALDIYTELQTLRELAKGIDGWLESPHNTMFLTHARIHLEKWKDL